MAELYRKVLEDKEKLNEIVKNAFDNVDKDKTGKINKDQLQSMMNQIYSDISHELPSKTKVDDVFDYLDTKKKGYINIEDFKVLVVDVIKSVIEEVS